MTSASFHMQLSSLYRMQNRRFWRSKQHDLLILAAAIVVAIYIRLILTVTVAVIVVTAVVTPVVTPVVTVVPVAVSARWCCLFHETIVVGHCHCYIYIQTNQQPDISMVNYCYLGLCQNR